jgi:hypothetical protein
MLRCVRSFGLGLSTLQSSLRDFQFVSPLVVFDSEDLINGFTLGCSALLHQILVLSCEFRFYLEPEVCQRLRDALSSRKSRGAFHVVGS